MKTRTLTHASHLGLAIICAMLIVPAAASAATVRLGSGSAFPRSVSGQPLGSMRVPFTSTRVSQPETPPTDQNSNTGGGTSSEQSDGDNGADATSAGGAGGNGGTTAGNGGNGGNGGGADQGGSVNAGNSVSNSNSINMINFTVFRITR